MLPQSLYLSKRTPNRFRVGSKGMALPDARMEEWKEREGLCVSAHQGGTRRSGGHVSRLNSNSLMYACLLFFDHHSPDGLKALGDGTVSH